MVPAGVEAGDGEVRDNQKGAAEAMEVLFARGPGGGAAPLPLELGVHPHHAQEQRRGMNGDQRPEPRQVQPPGAAEQDRADHRFKNEYFGSGGSHASHGNPTAF